MSSQKECLLVTGGAGFIGSNFIHCALAQGVPAIVNLDALTYAGNLENLASIEDDPRYQFVHGSICDASLVKSILETYQPTAILNFAAESHVDRSILRPTQFLETNVMGTLNLLEAARHYWDGLAQAHKSQFRFLHVSTDEVFGSLEANDPAFSETTAYAPNSPYAASKAGSDHLVRAWHHTYGLPILITNCSNNYGPYQFPEKLIPLMVHNALEEKTLPIYGDGQNIRDWLYVEDHCQALLRVLEGGVIGDTYTVGGQCEKTNLEVVGTICTLLDQIKPRRSGQSYSKLITFVADRPGHDRRYAIDSSHIQEDLNWRPKESFDSGLEKTIRWYLNHEDWVSRITSGQYQEWERMNYNERETL